ncbi:MAG: protease modulator HflK [Verrucomicrobiales bacterium]|nr:protease modulator HflK [Verrucomicrobiales bacterium]
MSDSNDQIRHKDGVGGPGLITLNRPRPAAEPPPEPELPDDAGTRALSEALRSSFVIVKVLMIGLVILFVCSGVFTVPSQKKAIILRFGKPVGTGEKMLLDPGLHWSFPYPIDEKIFIPLGQQNVRSTIGWYAVSPDGEPINPGAPSLNPAAEGYTITGDANIIHVRTDLNYRITDPLKYALNFMTASNAVQNALDSAIVFVSARTKVDDALRLERDRFREGIQDRFRDLVEQQGLGITLVSSAVEVVPPLGVKDKFDQVTAADASQGQLVQKAAGEANQMISAAQSEATNLVNVAYSDSKKMLEGLRADAQAFLDQLQYYTNNPTLFTERLRTEAIQKILTNAQEKYFLGRGAQLRVLLNRDPQKPAQPNTQP